MVEAFGSVPRTHPLVLGSCSLAGQASSAPTHAVRVSRRSCQPLTAPHSGVRDETTIDGLDCCCSLLDAERESLAAVWLAAVLRSLSLHSVSKRCKNSNSPLCALAGPRQRRSWGLSSSQLHGNTPDKSAGRNSRCAQRCTL